MSHLSALHVPCLDLLRGVCLDEELLVRREEHINGLELEVVVDGVEDLHRGQVEDVQGREEHRHGHEALVEG